MSNEGQVRKSARDASQPPAPRLIIPFVVAVAVAAATPKQFRRQQQHRPDRSFPAGLTNCWPRWGRDFGGPTELLCLEGRRRSTLEEPMSSELRLVHSSARCCISADSERVRLLRLSNNNGPKS